MSYPRARKCDPAALTQTYAHRDAWHVRCNSAPCHAPRLPRAAKWSRPMKLRPFYSSVVIATSLIASACPICVFGPWSGWVVEGTVTDRATGEPLNNILVVCEERNDNGIVTREVF